MDYKKLKKWIQSDSCMYLVTLLCTLLMIGTIIYLFCFAPKSNINADDLRIERITVTNFQTKDNLKELKKKYEATVDPQISVKYKGKVYQADLLKEKENSNAKVVYKFNVIKYKGKMYDPNTASFDLRWAAWISYHSLFPITRNDEVIINTKGTDRWKDPNQ